MNISLRLLSASIAFALLLMENGACHAQEGDLETLLGILDAQTDAIEGFSLKFKATDYYDVKNPDAPKADQLELPDPEKTLIKGEAVFDLVNGYYRVNAGSVLKWSNGAAPYVARRGAWSYDGESFREWNRERHGTDLPPREVGKKDVNDPTLGPSLGNIDATSPGPTWPEIWSWQTGAVYFPTLGSIWGQGDALGMTRLTDLLREAQENGGIRAVEKLQANLWRVTLAHDVTNGDVTLKVDSSYGGIIGAEWSGGTPPKVWQRLFVERARVDDGRSLPKRLVLINTIDAFARVVELSNIVVNPNLTQEDYRISFPKGTLVDDSIEEKTYMVSGGPVDDAKAVESYVQRHKLDPAAISASAEMGEAMGMGTWLLIAVNVAVLITVLAFLAIRHRQKSGAIVLFLFTLANTATAAELLPSGGWAVSYAQGESVQITQCGFNVAVAVLELSDRSYDPGRLSAALEPSADGIRFSSLVKVLRGHGLKTAARRDVTWEEMLATCRRGWLSIVPVRVSENLYHYILFMSREDGTVLLLDPPYRLREMTEAAIEDLSSQYPKLLVTFVRKPVKEVAPLKTTVSISTCRLRAPMPGSDNELVATGHLTIKNDSDKPVFVSKVYGSCGCTTLGWAGGLIGTGDEEKISVTVASAASSVEQKKYVYFSFPDKSKATAEIIIEPMLSDGVSVSTHEIRLRLPPCKATLEPGGNFATNIPWADKPVVELTETADRWLSYDLREDDGQARLAVGLRPERKKLVSSGALPADLGTITVRAQVPNGDRSIFRVRGFSPPPVTSEPRVVHLTREENFSESFVLVSSCERGHQFEVPDISTNVPGLSLQLERRSDQRIEVTCSLDDELDTDVVVVKCTATTGARTHVLSVPVLIE